jgi:hypothetical protein
MTRISINGDDTKQSTAHIHQPSKMRRLTPPTIPDRATDNHHPRTTPMQNNQPRFAINHPGMSRTITKYPGIILTTTGNNDTKQSTSRQH